jgi:hypothetical protein
MFVIHVDIHTTDIYYMFVGSTCGMITYNIRCHSINHMSNAYNGHILYVRGVDAWYDNI